MALDLLSHLPGPPRPPNAGTSALHGELFAYGSSSAVIVVDAQRLSVATSLVLHRSAAITALAWHPGLGPREPKTSAQLRLASGDEEGRVVLWNVSSGSVIAALEDPISAAFPGARRPEGLRPSVQGLAWVTAAPTVLAVLLSPGYLLLWDYKTNTVLWRKDLGAAGEVFTSIQVDPLDRRQFCVCGSRGTLMVVKAVNPAVDKVKQQQYQVDLGEKGTLRCAFARTHDLLFVLLQREIIVFDLEFGHPAASTQVPSSRPPLEGLLGSYGHAAAGKSLQDGGIDVLYCSHTDGSLSVWQRQERALTYSLLWSTRLLPSSLKFQAGRGPQLLAAAAGLWRGLQQAAAGAELEGRAGSPTPRTSAMRQPAPPTSPAQTTPQQPSPPQQASAPLTEASGWNPFEAEPAANPTNPFEPATNPFQAAGSPSSPDKGIPAAAAAPSGSAEGSAAAAGGGGAAAAQAATKGRGEGEGTDPQHLVLVMGVCSQGQVWQWQLPLLAGTATPGRKAAMPKAEVLGVLQNLPNRVTNFTVCAAPVVLPGGAQQVVAALAAATATGSIELVTVQQGTLGPLHASVAASLAAHKGSVPGMRWLGSSPRVVSFSTEKTQTGYSNTLLVTDVRNRVSMRVREVPNDPAPILAVRGSPSGRYLLVVFRGMPSEIWSVGGGDRPARLRQIDLTFTAVEWVVESQRESVGVTRWEPSTLAQERAAKGYPVQGGNSSSPRDEGPDERLAFALTDGRIGVLGVKGRRIQDTHPKRPVWVPLAMGEYRATAVAGWNHLVFFGDAEGGLVKWDTSTGRTFVLETGHGKIHKLYVASGPCEHLHPNAAGVQARLAVLYSSGTFGVFDLDVSNELRPTLITTSLVSSRLGRVADVEWLPLPPPVGSGSVLAVSLADGSLEFVDTVHTLEVRPRQQRLLRYKTVLNYEQPAGSKAAAPRLAPGVPLASPLLLPRPWATLLRVLLQRGVPESLFRELAVLAASSEPSGAGLARTQNAENTLERLENDLWVRLPVACRVAWEALLARHSEGVEAPSEGGGGGAVARILDDFANTAEEDMQSLEAAMAGVQLAAEASQGSPTPEASSGSPSPPLLSPPGGPAMPFRRPRGPMLGGGSPQQAQQQQGGSAPKKKEPVINFRSIGGAFASMATASKSQLSKLGLGQARQPSGLSPSTSAVWDGQDSPQSKAAFQCLVTVLQAAGYLRGQPSVLSPEELQAYSAALADRSTARRMEVAARVLGADPAEVQFWGRLPATLRWLGDALRQARSRSSSRAEGSSTPGPSQRSSASESGDGDDNNSQAAAGARAGAEQGSGAANGGEERLWDEGRELAEDSERSAWHEQMPRSIFEDSEALQEKRVLRYVALCDFHTAVGFLLASGPESSARYYRNALCTLAMAFACGTQQARQGAAAALLRGPGGAPAAASSGGGAIEDAAARTLFSQATKVVTANAASVGDSLLGVPLLCSTGQHSEAAHILQDSGLWYYATSLTASQLRGSERAVTLERWAGHVYSAEGRLWAAAGLLVAAGALRSALQLLRQAGLPDAAFALIAACREAEVPVEQHNLDTGELQNLFPASGPPVLRFSSAGQPMHGPGGGTTPRRTQTDYDANQTAREFQLFVCDVLQQL